MKQPELFNPFGAFLLSHEIPEVIFQPLLQLADDTRANLSDKSFVEKNSHSEYLAGKNSYQIKIPPQLLDKIGLDNYLLSLGDFYQQQHGHQQDLCMGSVWINFSYEGDINPIHTHDALFSGVIYIKQDESIYEEIKEYGGRNTHGCPGATHFIYSIDNHKYNKNFYTNNTKPGQLCMFPSWLSHYVNPHQRKGERITVAFNILEA
jgi:uncharacterized protein (TIGR02466 family)